MIDLNTLIEIKLKEDEDFLKIKETLTRIGIVSKKDNTLYQSCHILHKQGKYYLVHFKEMFAFDNKPSSFTEEDKGRRNKIASLLQDWGLLTIHNAKEAIEPMATIHQIKILSHKEKLDWNLESKYNIGKKR